MSDESFLFFFFKAVVINCFKAHELIIKQNTWIEFWRLLTDLYTFDIETGETEEPST